MRCQRLRRWVFAACGVGWWLGSAFAEYVIIAFMLFCGANFALHHRSLHDRRLVHLGDPEFRLFGVIVLAMTAVMFGALWWSGTATGWTAFRQSLFTVASLATTTGYANVDYGLWIPLFTGAGFVYLGVLDSWRLRWLDIGRVKVIRLALGVQLAVRGFTALIPPPPTRGTTGSTRRSAWTTPSSMGSLASWFCSSSSPCWVRSGWRLRGLRRSRACRRR